MEQTRTSIIVLDYGNGTAHNIITTDLPHNADSEMIEEYLDKLGYDLSNCHYMADEEKKIKYELIDLTNSKHKQLTKDDKNFIETMKNLNFINKVRKLSQNEK